MNTTYGEPLRLECWEGSYIPDLTRQDPNEGIELRENSGTNQKTIEERLTDPTNQQRIYR